MTSAVAGLAPALQSTRVDLTAGLRDGAAGSGRRRTRLRRAFLATQVTASTVLVACAGLFLHSLRNADDIDGGFEARGILNAPIELGRGRDAASSVTLVEQLESRLRELPGVAAVTAATVAPLTGSNAETSIQRDGDDVGNRHHTYFVSITPTYFATMRMSLVAGREFVASDRAGAPGVAIVNETLARQLWLDQSPLGKRIRFPCGGVLRATIPTKQLRTASDRRMTNGDMVIPYAYSDLTAMMDPGLKWSACRAPFATIRSAKRHRCFCMFPLPNSPIMD